MYICQSSTAVVPTHIYAINTGYLLLASKFWPSRLYIRSKKKKKKTRQLKTERRACWGPPCFVDRKNTQNITRAWTSAKALRFFRFIFTARCHGVTAVDTGHCSTAVSGRRCGTAELMRIAQGSRSPGNGEYGIQGCILHSSVRSAGVQGCHVRCYGVPVQASKRLFCGRKNTWKIRSKPDDPIRV